MERKMQYLLYIFFIKYHEYKIVWLNFKWNIKVLNMYGLLIEYVAILCDKLFEYIKIEKNPIIVSINVIDCWHNSLSIVKECNIEQD